MRWMPRRSHGVQSNLGLETYNLKPQICSKITGQEIGQRSPQGHNWVPANNPLTACSSEIGASHIVMFDEARTLGH